MKPRQIPAQKVEAPGVDMCPTLPKHIVSFKLFYVQVDFVFFMGLISRTTDPARVGTSKWKHGVLILGLNQFSSPLFLIESQPRI